MKSINAGLLREMSNAVFIGALAKVAFLQLVVVLAYIPGGAKACVGNPLYDAIEHPGFKIGISKTRLAQIMATCAYTYKPPKEYWQDNVFISCPGDWRDGGSKAFVFKFRGQHLSAYALFEASKLPACKGRL